MNTFIETKLFSITSDSATTKNNNSFLSDVVFEANNFIKNDNILNLDVALIHAEIPVSFYVINEYNNQFRFKLDTNPITTKSIDYGNYNSSSLITALKTALNDTNFIITISKITGKLTFTYNIPFIIYNNFNFSIGSILGFESNTINNSVGSSNPYTLTPVYMLNLLGAKKLNILSSEINTSNFSSEVGTLSMLSSIAVDVPAYGLIIYENKSGFKNNLQVRDINRIDIQIVDENHNFINFNNISWSMLICFYITRTINVTIENNFNSLIKNDISQNDIIQKKDIIKENKDLKQLEFLFN
jgi:hypothetical protein